jgi:ubiquinone/menaquinone biosynthesis C-methylase UbiE
VTDTADSTLRPASEAGSVANSERAWFDEFVARSGGFDPFTPEGWNVLRRGFQRLIPVPVRGAMLDVGCGTGSSLAIYEGCFETYTGIDLSPRSIELARNRFPQHDWRVGDACQLPFADDSFDLVAFSSVLHHIPDFSAAVVEARRVLKPGGVVFAYDPNLLHPAMALLRHPRSPLYLPEGVSPNERPLTSRELRRAFEAAGFRSIVQRGQSGISYRYAAPRFIRGLLSAFNAVDRIWEWSGAGRWFGTFLLTGAVK